MRLKFKCYITFFATVTVWLLLDLVTKWWALSDSFQPWIIIKNIFYLTRQLNSGIAFGIALPYKIQIIGSVILLLLLTGWILWVIQKETQKTSEPKRAFLNSLLFGIIIGGGLGNLVERVRAEEVTDFIVLKPFPTFNIADIGITMGIILFLTISIFKKSNH